MYKILAIEWIKNKSNLSFWIILAVYALAVYIICSSGTILMSATMEFTTSGDNAQGFPELNMYEFPDIWHNLSYIGSFVRIMLALIIIINITSEISQRTLRQNIIDGLSQMEFLASKMIFTLFLALFSTLLLFVIGLYFGNQYSSEWNYEIITSRLGFVGGYFLEIFGYLCFAVLVSLWLKKSGIVIVIVAAYSIFFEPFLGWIFLDSEGFLIKLLPINSLDNIITSPINVFDPESVQTQLDPTTLGIAFGWIVAFIGLSYLLLVKRDW